MARTTGLTLDQVAALLNIPVPIAALRSAEGSLPFVRFNGDRFISPHAAVLAVESGEWNVAEQTKKANAAIYGPQRLADEIREKTDAVRAKAQAVRQAEGAKRADARLEREAKVTAAREAAMAGSNLRRA